MTKALSAEASFPLYQIGRDFPPDLGRGDMSLRRAVSGLGPFPARSIIRSAHNDSLSLKTWLD